ncbi:MAG TPA: M48 family metallopeptidase, partial [Xanthomonadales bacterium]|nr:M48 family metallopeptidase [Xanthomonadales bacterium]
SMERFRQNLPLLGGGALVCAMVIGLASLYRMSSLRSGGGQVARELGGTLVDIEPADPLRRRLRNVVEEIALASGVSVPEIYVLEKEAGINAFAAGFSPSDAAIAVTRGCLEKLNRNELQGVIAHEFSHVLNGDMRLNIRLMGALFGILLLALIGRRVLMHTRHIGGSRDKNGGAIILIAMGLLLVGYVGQFFGRWIKAAVSRQREYLADASAVQFTRDNQGIGGALKKIAMYNGGSVLAADTEEIGHMLFSNGRKMMLFATHPAIEKRIKAIDPSFRPEELDELRARLVREVARKAEEQEAARSKAMAENKARKSGAEIFLNPAELIEQIGKPGWEHMVMAAAMTASIPLNIRRAAQSTEWAAAVLFYTLLDEDRELREEQLLVLAGQMDSDTESQVRSLLDAGGEPSAEQRLPLLELAFPALKRHPVEYISKVLKAMQAIVTLDGRIDIFEYLLSRITLQYVWEAQSPSSVRMSGNKSLASCQPQALRLLTMLAIHGNASDQAAREAFAAGATVLGKNDAEMPVAEMGPGQWPAALDQDLPVLDRLAPREKQKLLAALVSTVMKDGKTVVEELELLRVTCDLLHVPLPMLSGRKPG